VGLWRRQLDEVADSYSWIKLRNVLTAFSHVLISASIVAHDE
jgi:hypothetical protein